MNALLLAAWIGCQSLDFGTTAIALNSGRFVEGNAIIRSTGHIYAVKASVNVGAFIWRQKARKDSPAKRIVPLGMAVTGCAAGLWNVHQLASVR